MNKNLFWIFSLICLVTLAINMMTTYSLVSNFFVSLNDRRKELGEIYNYESYLSLIKDAETAHRGFLITQDEEFLEPYELARKYLQTHPLEKELVDFDPSLEQISLVKMIAYEKMKQIEKVVNTMKTEGFEAAQKLVKTKKGKKLMDQLRSLTHSIINRKQERIDHMDASIKKSMDSTIRLFIVSNTIGAILLGFCLYSIFRSNKKLATKEKELSRALQDLNKSSALNEAILLSANHSIISTDEKGTITSFNPAAEKMLGYNKEEMIGRVTPAVFHDEKEMRERSLVLSKQFKRKIPADFETFVVLAKEGKADTNEWTYIRKDGSRFPVSLCVTAKKNAKGEIIGFLGIAYDITERKKIERMKNELMAVTSHELRAPIVAIKGAFDLLSHSEFSLSEKGRKILEIGQQNCLRIVRLTEDILDVEKIEMGMVQFNFKKIHVASFIARIMPSLVFAGQQAEISIFHKPVPEKWFINGDEDRLVQVMHNLVSNAINHSPKGSTIEINVQKMDSKLRFEIKDKGKGIKKELREKISEQLSPYSTQNIFEKTGGFGLKIAKTILEKHHGILGYQTSDQGTSFWFDLPLEESMSYV